MFIKISPLRAGDIAQLVEPLHSIHKDPVTIPSATDTRHSGSRYLEPQYS